MQESRGHQPVILLPREDPLRLKYEFLLHLAVSESSIGNRARHRDQQEAAPCQRLIHRLSQFQGSPSHRPGAVPSSPAINLTKFPGKLEWKPDTNLSRGVSAHCPRRADILSALDATQPFAGSSEH